MNGINIKKKSAFCYITLALLFVANFTSAQQVGQDSLRQAYADSVLVQATRLPTPADRLPYALSQLEEEDIQAGQSQQSLAEPLYQLPGLLVLNPYNFAQDLRLSVRGFGARAAFGIRGLSIALDGFPESTPDGQGQVDNLEAGFLGGVELLRGPSSALYGNASGGVLRFRSAPIPEQPEAELRFITGSFGYQRLQLRTAGRSGAWGWSAYGGHTVTEGFREQSLNRSTLVNARLERELDNGGRLAIYLNGVNSPVAEDPGSLTDSLAQADPQAAWPRNLLFDGRESVQQGRIGLRWEQPVGQQGELETSVFLLGRDFENRLPFGPGGAVQLQRTFTGGRAVYRWRGSLWEKPLRTVVGTQIGWQSDERQRYDNEEGALGDLAFDQTERFSAIGLFLLQEWALHPQFWLTGSLRWDYNRLRAEDAFLADGDDSGSRRYRNLSPSLGISYEWRPAQFLYANYSYSFETPALSELSANPEGGGFNTSLNPQRAYNTEAGGKGQLAGSWRYQLAAFYIALQQELQPYELDGQPGRVFFRNAGRSERMGLEAALQWSPGSPWSAKASYTFSHFRYRDYRLSSTDFSGNFLPGIPEHQAWAALSYDYTQKGTLTLEGRYLSEIFANDANTAAADDYLLLGLRASQSWHRGNWSGQLFGGVNNLLDAAYQANVRLNAFGGRYFEPGPPRNYYIGISVGIGGETVSKEDRL